jgi:hypothetical protein
MKIGRRFLLAGGAAFVVRPAGARRPVGLRDLARRAGLYLTPLSEMYVRRHRDTVVDGQKLNRLARRPLPEDGLLLATAWLDLSVDPMFLTLPAMDDRFYSAAFIDPSTDALAHVSSRLSGSAPRPHMIAGPGWQGDAPHEVILVKATARSIWLRLVIAADDSGGDLQTARALLARCLLETPDQRNERRIVEMRELMRNRTYAPYEPMADWPAPRPDSRFDRLDTGLAMLGECVTSESDRTMLENLAPLRLHPGYRFDARAFAKAELEEIAAGLADAEEEIRHASLGQVVAGWRYPPPNIAAFGTDYFQRACVAATELGKPLPAEILDVKAEADGSFEPPSPLPARAVRWLARRRIARFFQPDAALLDGRYRLTPPVAEAAPPT